jgi:hypothetical protein
MFEMFIPPVAVLGIGYVLIRRLQRPKGTKPFAVAPPSPLRAATARSWRDAANESETLRIAVEQMVDHYLLAEQSIDAWLTAANLNIREPSMFRRNVLEADAMLMQLEEECAAVVEELRTLERKRDQAAAFDARRDQAIAFVTWARQQELLLRQRLQEVAHSSGMDPNVLRDDAARRSPTPVGGQVDRLLLQFGQEQAPSLRSVVA